MYFPKFGYLINSHAQKFLFLVMILYYELYWRSGGQSAVGHTWSVDPLECAGKRVKNYMIKIDTCDT